jgi:hypothetical protein
LFADSNYTVNNLKSYFSQLLNVYNGSDISQIEVHSAEALLTDSSHLQFEIDSAELKKYKSPGSGQTPAELDKEGCIPQNS